MWGEHCVRVDYVWGEILCGTGMILMQKVRRRCYVDALLFTL